MLCRTGILRAKILFGVTGLYLVVACKAQEGGFAGEGRRAYLDKKPKPQLPQEDIKQDDPPLPKPSKCVEAKLESVNSLTSFVTQNQSSGTLELELNFEPCLEQIGRVQLPILFDVDANALFLPGQERRLSYEVSMQGVRVAGPGAINTVFGEDVFGKTGADFAHFRSDGALSVAPNISTARLTVKLNSMFVVGPVNSTSYATSNFSVPVYVRIGQSPPVRTNVVFAPAVLPN
jgi:hypothetical protein